MKLFEALVYPFREPGWFGKLAIATLIAAIPVVGFFIIKGWEFEISMRVRHDTPSKLPPWRNYGIKFMRGVIVRIIGFIYNIPTYIIFGILFFIWIRIFVAFFNADQQTWEVFRGLVGQASLPTAGLVALLLVYMFLGNSMFWSGYLRYIETNDLWDFFDLITNFRLTIANIWDDLIMGFYMFLLGILVGAVDGWLIGLLSATGVGALIAPVLVPALTFTFLTWVNGHFFGQLAIRTLD